MTGATSTKEDITLNGFNHITAEMFEHTLSLEEHDENAKDFSLPGNQILIYYIFSKDLKEISYYSIDYILSL